MHNPSYSSIIVDLSIVSRTSEWMLPVFILLHGLLTAGSLVAFEEWAKNQLNWQESSLPLLKPCV